MGIILLVIIHAIWLGCFDVESFEKDGNYILLDLS